MTAAELHAELTRLDTTIQRWTAWGTVPRHLAEARTIYTYLQQRYIQTVWRELTEKAKREWDAGR